MASENIPKKDGFFGEWIDNFAAVAADNATALGLSTGQVAALTAIATAYQTAYDASQLGKVTAKSLIADKDAKRQTAEDLFRPYAKIFAADPGLTDLLKAELGLKTSPTPLGPVVTPTGLEVKNLTSGANQLKWGRTGNGQGTSFIIESSSVITGPYTIIGTVTQTKFVATGNLPGDVIYYRVSAKRAGIQSLPCDPVVTYGSPSVETFTLRQAA